MYDLPRIQDLSADEIARILSAPVPSVLLPATLADLHVSIGEGEDGTEARASTRVLSEFDTAA